MQQLRPFRFLRHAALGLALLLGLAAGPAWTQGYGQPPAPGTAARDLVASFKLPPLRDATDGELSKQLATLQLGRRAHQLKLTPASALEAWRRADAALASARTRLDATPPGATPRPFTGSRASQLNAVLRDPAVTAVQVTSARIEVDEPILIRRAGLRLELGRAELHAAANGPRFLLRIENAAGVTVDGGAFVGGQWGVLVSGGRDVTLRGGRYDGLQYGGVVFTDTVGAVLGRSRLMRIGGAPLLIHGPTTGSAVVDNDISGNLGSSNWHAGVVISDRRGAVAVDPFSILNADRYGVREQAIDSRLQTPRRNVLAGNRITQNASSGIYSDGGVENVMLDNVIEGNSKEGLCLDNGTTANVVAMNLVRQNGKRWGKTDAELRLDFVLGLGRMADGSAVAKTPGISLDNALYNVVYANQIDRNFGGGVKMVRTAFFNTIGLNLITDNNEGANSRFHFFGIEFGAAQADVPVTDLDFSPSRGNMVFGNAIRGAHYAGIFYGADSTQNDTFDNSIFGATAWAMEQVRRQANSSLNNLTNLPSRNIDAGLDPKLLQLTKGRYD